MNNLPVIVDSLKENTIRYVTFNVGEEVFGVDIMCVESIIPLQKITNVPRTPEYFLGIINLRGEVISIVDMRKRFGLEPQKPTADTRVVVILTNGILVGMVVDKINAIEALSPSSIQSAPPLAVLEQKKFISGSFKLANSKILLILFHEKLIDEKNFIIDKDMKFNQEVIESHIQKKEDWVREIPLVSFKIGREHYTIESGNVEEIIFLPEITSVPDLDDIVEGIFYLRESMVPIIRLGVKIGLGPVKIKDDSQVIILKNVLFGIKIGLIVDDISEIFFIKEDELVHAPININKVQGEHLKGVFKYKRGNTNLIVMLLNLEKLFSEQEKDRLKELEQISKQEEIKTKEAEAVIGILEFMIAEERYAIRVAQTNEIIRITTTVPVPNAPQFIKGIINLRGDVISIVDLSLLVDKKRREPTKDSRILIVNSGNETAGLMVEKVIGIRKIMISSFEPPSDLLKQKGNIFIEGIGKIDESGEIVVLMDIETTLLQAQTVEEEDEDLEQIRKELEFLEMEDEKLQLTMIEDY
ncbi:chemotaxis protein CheW [bacterium]|nr:chemotaxis protein CheW [bacterium]